MEDFKSKNILVFGLGLNQGGVGTARFFAKNGANVKVTDLKSFEVLQPSLNQLKEFSNIEYTLGEHRKEDLDWADIIIRNPAVKDSNEYLKLAQSKGKRIETDFSIFLKFTNQENIIAITGTKGKSTTASLIHEALKASNKNVVFAGNIGKSILDTISNLEDKTLIVVEVSSFQLQTLKEKNFSPHIAVITNIYPDHLNWHTSMEEYINAKKAIAVNQTTNDYLLISCQKILNTEEFLKGLRGKTISFCGEEIAHEEWIEKLPLKGDANLDNYAIALKVSEILELDKQTTLQAFQNFKGADFRMQLAGEYKGIKIINDSTATNPIATIEALRSTGSCILIAGGMNKGLEYHELAAEIEANIKNLYLLEGDASQEILKYIRDKSIIKGKGLYDDLIELLINVKESAKNGDIILFSPGATSFNLFQNEFDRGRKFNEAVEKVFNS